MTNDDIIRMAKESKVLATVELAEFAKKVAAHEREACAQLCEDLWEDDGTAWDCAVAIEKRGNQ